jgi:dephospho-CoA kinase
MIIIGLTGGIGTGKSTVSNYLKEHNCLILDADAISRQMTEKGQPALIDIAKAFGEDLLVDGVLDRQALGNIVFNDKEKLDILQSIITNKVVEYINTRIEELKAERYNGIVVIDAPLLFECGMEGIADENWLVSASLDVRLQRVSQRDGLSEEQILSRINNQMPQEEKEKLSQVILDNSGSLEDLYKQINENLERIKDEL